MASALGASHFFPATPATSGRSVQTGAMADGQDKPPAGGCELLVARDCSARSQAIPPPSGSPSDPSRPARFTEASRGQKGIQGLTDVQRPSGSHQVPASVSTPRRGRPDHPALRGLRASGCLMTCLLSSQNPRSGPFGGSRRPPRGWLVLGTVLARHAFLGWGAWSVQ